jgi:hypothetical protein
MDHDVLMGAIFLHLGQVPAHAADLVKVESAVRVFDVPDPGRDGVHCDPAGHTRTPSPCSAPSSMQIVSPSCCDPAPYPYTDWIARTVHAAGRSATWRTVAGPVAP